MDNIDYGDKGVDILCFPSGRVLGLSLPEDLIEANKLKCLLVNVNNFLPNPKNISKLVINDNFLYELELLLSPLFVVLGYSLEEGLSVMNLATYLKLLIDGVERLLGDRTGDGLGIDLASLKSLYHFLITGDATHASVGRIVSLR